MRHIPTEIWESILQAVLHTCEGPCETRHMALLALCHSSRSACYLPSAENVFLTIFAMVSIQKKVAQKVIAPMFKKVSTRPGNDDVTVDSGVGTQARLRFTFRPVQTGAFCFRLECARVDMRIVHETAFSDRFMLVREDQGHASVRHLIMQALVRSFPTADISSLQTYSTPADDVPSLWAPATLRFKPRTTDRDVVHLPICFLGGDTEDPGAYDMFRHQWADI